MGFLIDIAQLAFGSTIGRIILGVVVGVFIILYIVGKILNAQEARQTAAISNSTGSNNSGQAEPNKINLDKSR